jgi:hypothetical protein
VRAAPILAVLLATLAAAPAEAWQEVPFRTVPAGDAATCLRATGRDGSLTALGPGQDRAGPVDLLAAGPERPAVRARVQFGPMVDCPVLREQGGVAVAAVPDLRLRSPIALRVALRDGGGAFGAPVGLGRAGLSAGSYDAAVGPSGHAVVAWVRFAGSGKRLRARIVAARRAPGAAFGPPEAITPWFRGSELAPDAMVAAGIDGAGSATVAWTAPGRDLDEVGVRVAGAPPGAAFGAPQVLSPRADSLARLVLAVAPDGGALLAHEGAKTSEDDGVFSVRLFERAAGAAAFGAGRELGSARSDALEGASDPALAVRDAGAAVVAWRDDGDAGAVRAMTRPAGGSFGLPRAVARVDAKQAVDFDDAPDYSQRADLGISAALAGDGRAALAWSAPRRLPDAPIAPLAATGTLTEGFGAAAVLGSPVRAIGAVNALVLAGGEPAAAWTDNETSGVGLGDSTLEVAQRSGRIHVARAGAAGGPAARPPAAGLRAPRVQRLTSERGVYMEVRCAAACDVRAYLRKRGEVAVVEGLSLPAAGVRSLVLGPGIGALAPRRPRRFVVRVRVAAPGSPVARTLRLSLRLVRR